MRIVDRQFSHNILISMQKMAFFVPTIAQTRPGTSWRLHPRQGRAFGRVFVEIVDRQFHEFQMNSRLQTTASVARER